MALTKARKEKYLKEHGVRCPYCSSGDLNTIGSLKTDTYGQVTQDVQCLNCGKIWTDHHTLSDITE